MLKVYLDSSIFNAKIGSIYCDKTKNSFIDGKRKEITEIFLDKLKRSEDIKVYISEVVLQELNQTPVEKRRQLLLSEVNQLSAIILKLNEGVIDLANFYLKSGLLTKKHYNDLLHIAFVSFFSLDILYSWDKKHIVKKRINEQIEELNRLRKISNIVLSLPYQF